MRHARFGRKLSRDTNARRALLSNLTSSLFINGAVITTLAKAKFARPHVEKLVTDAKKNRLSSNRLIASVLGYQAFKNLIKQASQLYDKRTSGFTRITKIGPRRGDNTQMARLELLDWKKVLTTDKSKSGKKTKNLQKVTKRKSSIKARKLKDEKH